MEGISSGNNDHSPGLVTRIVCGICLASIMAPLHGYTQCKRDATGWLSELAVIEASDAATEEKISRLSAVKEEIEQCDGRRDSVYARIVHRLGDLHRNSGDFERAIRLTAEAIAINKSKRPGSQRSYLTHSYYNLGLYNNLLGLPAEAHLYYDSCINIGTQYPDKIFIALMAMEKKAFLYFQAGDYEQGIRISQRGLMLAKSTNAPAYEALLLIQKAQCESGLDRSAEARENVYKAILILNSNQLKSYLPNAYSVYALVLRGEKQFDAAISYYTKAFELNLEQGNHEQAARDLHALAFLYDKELNSPKESISLYSRALELLETIKDPYMLAATFNNLGQVWWRNGEFQNALKFYQKGLMALTEQFQDADIKANPSPSMLATMRNEYIAAALLWNKGDSWLGLYGVEKDTRYLENAIAAYRAGDRMVDQMRWKQQGQQSKLYWRQKTKGWYQHAIEASYLLGSPEDAFHFMEKSRAVLLNDKLAELGARNQLPVTEAETEKALRMKLQAVLAQASANPDDGRLANDLWQAEHKLNSFITELEKKYPSYYTYKYDTAVYSMSDLQKMLAARGQAWIELFTTDNIIFALTITGSEKKLARISFVDHATTANRILELCSSKSGINRNFSEFHSLSNLYYNKVFKPLNISTRRIIVSYDDYFLPFDLLQKDSADHQSFLLHEHAFSYAYSAAHFLREKQRKESPDQLLLAIAPVNYKPYLHLQDLHGADQSLKNIRAMYNGGAILTGNTATKHSFLQQISAATVVHLYSHAKADSLSQEPTIYFYDSALNLSELENLENLNTQLIVLFACNTGVGKTIKGEGIFSLARGFAAAGIPSTISALWEIDNKSTYHLSELFFRGLGKGEPTDVALQKAKLEMIKGDAYALPYYWAGAVLIGKPDVYQPGHNSSNFNYKHIAWLGFIGTVAAIVFVIVRKQRSRKPEHVL